VKPLITLCRACGEIEITHDGRAARPKVTCSEECDRIWRTARSNASRAKSKAAEGLRMALRQLSKVRPCRVQERIAQALAELEEIKPGVLAIPPQRPVPHLPPEGGYLPPTPVRELP
jgi:hypothetical protein